jgi:hypothetical protein
MSQTSKPNPAVNFGNAIVASFNQEDKSITTSSFLTAKVGHKIQYSAPDTVTDDWSYYDGTNLLYTIRVIYTDITKSQISSVARIA